MLLQELELFADGQALHGNLDMGQVGKQVLAVAFSRQDDEMIVLQVVARGQLSENALGPGPAFRRGHGVEGDVVGGDDLIQVHQAVFGGEDVDGVGLELAGVGQTKPKQRAGVQLRGRRGLVQLLANAGVEDDAFHSRGALAFFDSV